MQYVRDIESEILDELRLEGPCNMDDLVRRLPSYTWNQIFAVLDRMSRQGKIHIQCKRRFEYEVSAPILPVPGDRDGSQGMHRWSAA